MTLHPSRRDFLLRLAKTASYVPPTLVALGSPDTLAAQGPPTDKGTMGGMGKGKGKAFNLTMPGTEPVRTAPWEPQPPGDEE